VEPRPRRERQRSERAKNELLSNDKWGSYHIGIYLSLLQCSLSIDRQ